VEAREPREEASYRGWKGGGQVEAREPREGGSYRGWKGGGTGGS
jgi:hypothetical protein